MVMISSLINNCRFFQSVAVVLPFVMFYSSNAVAQKQDAGALEEITVTARKINESLQDVPVAVSAFTAADLTARGVNSLEEIASYTPNVEFFASGISGKNSGQAYIRGVGQFDYLLSTDPGVGVYVDGVYLARSLGNLLDLVDIERVEILRGPQGTLYGKNTIGGAINVITRKPGDEFEANVEIRTGSYDRIDARVNVSGPIIADKLAGKLAIGTKNAGGFGERPLVGDRAGDEESNAIQGMLDWTPADNFNVVFSADYTRVNETFSQHHTEEINTAAPLVGIYGALAGPLAGLHGVPLPVYDTSWITGDAYVDQSTGSNFNDQEIWGIANTITWEVAGLTLKSITSYREMDVSFGTDPDGSPAVIIDEVDVNTQNQVSQELQISGLSFNDRLNWVAGLYYLYEDAESTQNVRTYEGIFQAFEALPGPIFPLAPGLVCPAAPPAPCAGGAGNPVNIALDIGRFSTLAQKTESLAVYGQGSFALSDKLNLIYGIRYTDEKKDFTYSATLLQSGVPQVPLTTVGDSWTDVSHRIGIDYQWTDDLMSYFSAAKGFKSGGFNGRGRSANAIQSYEPEEMWTYEIGFKSEWLERRLRLNGAAFYNDYTDLQFTLSAADANGAQVIIVGNAGTAEVKGFELELQAVPVEQFNVTASVGFLDAKYTEVDPGVGISVDNKLIGSPKWTAAIGGEYTIPVTDLGSLGLRIDYSHRSKVYFDAVNTETGAQGGYGLLNFRATFTNVDEKWSLTAGVTNMTDEVYKVMGIGVRDSLGFVSSIYGRPREWFLQANYHF